LARSSSIGEIVEKYRPVWVLGHSMAVLRWDMETHMPDAGARSRGLALGQLAVMVQKATLELDGLVGAAEKSRDLDDVGKGMVRVLKRSLDYYQKVPPKLVGDLRRTTAEATVVWRTARKKSDFQLFKPHLDKILRLEREVAERLGYEKHPYDALMDEFEEGFTVSDADAVFAALIPGIRKILAKVQSEGNYPAKHPLESRRYETAAMERVNEGVLELMQMPRDRFRMDVSAHPFTTTIAPEDVRITTRYEGVDFKSTLFSTVHESGHALYNLGVDGKLAYTPIGGGASFGIHESQSRFWENLVGRSREFVRILDPLLRKNLSFIAPYDCDQLYYYFNSVKKSFIRVDADELTYNLHIALRYEVEKRLIAGDMRVSEVPELWNDTFEKYLGMRPRNDAEGVLQDVHWSGGSFGYFPSYSLGNIVVGMIWHEMKDGEFVREAVGRGDLTSLRTWLKTRIHRYGATYSPKVLQEKVFGDAYNPAGLLAYLSEKFAG